MAERAGIFDPVDPIDYRSLSSDTFNWTLWIEQETRRRYKPHLTRESEEN
jgi:hypothetical protein